MIDETTMPPPPPDEVTVRALLETVGTELKDRLDSGKLGSVNSATLIKFYLDGQKALAANSVPDGDDGADEEIDLVEKLDSLPPAYAVGVIEREIERLDTEAKQWKVTLKRFVKLAERDAEGVLV